MECVRPITLKEQTELVPCGYCFACLSNRQYAWSFRLNQELKVSTSAKFITLTYNSENLPITMIGEKYKATLYKKDPQNFMKKLRKLQKAKLKYYMVGEYGTETRRPHYHYIMFNIEVETEQKLEKTWNKGNIDIGNVTPASIHYVTGYLVNNYETNSAYKLMQRPFALMSKGLGANYLKANYKYHSTNNRHYVQTEKGKQAIPKYYKDRIFTTEQNDQNRAQMAEISYTKRRKEYIRLSQSGVKIHEYQKEQIKATENAKNKQNKKNKSI